MDSPPPTQLPTLTISVAARKPGAYRVELAFTRPSTAADAPSVEGDADFDAQILQEAAGNPKAYGARLARGLLADASLSQYFNDSLAIARNSAQPYRLRLRIHANAPELHAWRWEMLCHPRSGKFLASDANLRWTRQIFSPGWDEIKLQPKGELRALIAIANPVDLKKGVKLLDYSLSEVDVPGELRRAREALAGVGQIDELTSPPEGPWQVTLENLSARLRQGYDILYLVCHGALLPEDPFAPESPRKPYLLLEKPGGQRDRVDGDDLVSQVASLDAPMRPLLVVLASCQSAGQELAPDPESAASSDRGALAALGPRLAEAGVPAVIAMQGDIKMKTVEKFMPVFFQELVKDGQLERAMALGRSAAIAAKCEDWWAPALYSRLKEGQLFERLEAGSDPLAGYLTSAGQKPRFNYQLNPSLMVLWESVPYRARQSGQPGGQATPLFDLVQALFPLDARGRYQHAVLLGSAGQGKTTALRWLLSSCASQALELLKAGEGSRQPSPISVPVYIGLNKLRQGIALERLALEAVNERLEEMGISPIRQDRLREWGTQHRLLFLVDDLEALISWRHGIGIEALTQFMRAEFFRDQCYLIACRSSSYQNQLGMVDLLELADLDPSEVENVLGKDLLAQFSPQIKRLAQNRSMLHLILDVKNQKFRTKGQLFKIWVERELELDAERVDGVDSYLARTVLERLAFEMRRSHSQIIDETRVIELVNSLLTLRREKYHWRDVVDYLRKIEALQLDPVRRGYSFAERTFGDYFSAAAVAGDPELRKLVLETVSDYWWRDMLEILVGLVEDPAALMYEIIDRDAIVAALCVQSAPLDQDSPVYSALTDGLVEQMDQKSSSHRKQIVERIIESEHPRVPEVLMRRLHREWSSQVIISIARGLERWKQKPGKIEELIKMEAAVLSSFAQQLESYEEWLRIQTPVCQAADGCEEAEQARNGLERLEQILDDPGKPAKMRGLAAISLGLSRYRQAGLKLLELLATPDLDDLVAWCVVEALAEFPLEDVRKQTYALLRRYGLPEFMEKPPRYRARLIYLLGWMRAEGCSVDDDCNESPSQEVLEKALKDGNPLVRGFAIHAMVQLNFKGVLRTIEGLLEAETEPLVLRKAAEALGQIGTRDSIKVLEGKLKVDVVQINQSVRSAYRSAIREIQERYGV